MQIARLPHLRLAFALLIASLLSGCGFHLRGSYLVPEEVDAMSLSSYDDYSQLTRDVKTELRNNGINIVTPAANITNIHLISETLSDRTLSLYQNSRAAEKEIKLVVKYRVVVPNIGTNTFTTQVSRSYLDNPLTALAKSVEQDMLENEMRKQASRQLIRQLARLRNNIDNHEVGSIPGLDVDDNGMMIAPIQPKADTITIDMQSEDSTAIDAETSTTDSSPSTTESNSDEANSPQATKTTAE
ncbi:LPS assembly lipoprotein LptE [Vibrio rarus]|uniref:LPS-assembly lipoprotein LptE n=1 Tax=Vibrio rarus TaxID=413403 RepID=UPI0036F1E567